MFPNVSQRERQFNFAKRSTITRLDEFPKRGIYQTFSEFMEIDIDSKIRQINKNKKARYIKKTCKRKYQRWAQLFLNKIGRLLNSVSNINMSFYKK